MADPRSNLALRKFVTYCFAALSLMVCGFVIAQVVDVSKFEISEARVSCSVWTRNVDEKFINC